MFQLFNLFAKNALNMICKYIDYATLNKIAMVFDKTINGEDRSLLEDFIYDCVFEGELMEDEIDAIYDILGRDILRYDDDDYVDDLIKKTDKLYGICYFADVKSNSRLYLIRNALAE